MTPTAGWSCYLSADSPPAPQAARAVFGAALPVAEAYARLLAGPGVERGLIGPSETARIWDRHLLNSAVVADLVPDRCVLADLGSGAGLPGLVLAMVRPACRVIVIEPMARRTAFLQECADALSLPNVEVCRGRGEELAGTIAADIVTARAVRSLDRLAPLAAGLARPGGQVLAIKGASAADEVDSARLVLRRLGAVDVEVLTVGSGVLDQPTTVVRFVVPAVTSIPASRDGRRGDSRPPGPSRQPGSPRRPRRT